MDPSANHSANQPSQAKPSQPATPKQSQNEVPLTDPSPRGRSAHLRTVDQTHRHVDGHDALLPDLQRAAPDQPRALLEGAPVALRVSAVDLQAVLGAGLGGDDQLVGGLVEDGDGVAQGGDLQLCRDRSTQFRYDGL